MLCINCPFQFTLEPIDDSDDTIFCEINNEPKNPDDECFFPETMMEKGV